MVLVAREVRPWWYIESIGVREYNVAGGEEDKSGGSLLITNWVFSELHTTAGHMLPGSSNQWHSAAAKLGLAPP